MSNRSQTQQTDVLPMNTAAPCIIKHEEILEQSAMIMMHLSHMRAITMASKMLFHGGMERTENDCVIDKPGGAVTP